MHVSWVWGPEVPFKFVFSFPSITVAILCAGVKFEFELSSAKRLNLEIISLFLSSVRTPGALHSVGAAKEEKASWSQRWRRLAWHGQRVRGSSGCSWWFQEVGLRLCPPGGLRRAHHLREEHEALVSGPGHLCLQTQLQLDWHAPQEETHSRSHSPQRLRGMQSSTQLCLGVSSTALQLLLCSGRLTGYTHRGGNRCSSTGPKYADSSRFIHTNHTSFSAGFWISCTSGSSSGPQCWCPQLISSEMPWGRFTWRLDTHPGDSAGELLVIIMYQLTKQFQHIKPYILY